MVVLAPTSAITIDPAPIPRIRNYANRHKLASVVDGADRIALMLVMSTQNLHRRCDLSAFCDINITYNIITTYTAPASRASGCAKKDPKATS
jgi:hypothetical protein